MFVHYTSNNKAIIYFVYVDIFVYTYTYTLIDISILMIPIHMYNVYR